MARPTTVFICATCGHQEPKWHGRCSGCGEWNTLAEEARAPAGRGGTAARGRAGSAAAAARPVRLADVEAVRVARLRTGIGELDRVLGGGLVPGSLVLLGGSPGIGKSTLTSMALGNLAGAGRRTLYISGEESAAQIKLRAERLPGAALDVPVLAETDLDTVLATLDAERPEVCVVDSVQTLHAADLTGAAGSVGQVREVADRITRLAKARDIAVLLVGHVTKEGALAGPRVLEHLVDCVLQFEGERERTYRTLRALKNRFGSTSEAGVFEMRQGGLVEVQDASARFVGEATRAPGSVVLAAMEGSRPLLVEVQALVSPSELVPPRRVANGIDRNRLALVLAVLGRHAGVGVGTADVFVNVAGGVRVDEPGADLAVALAVASAAKGIVAGAGERPIACFGEIGLTGELRTVGHPERRLAEAAKFGLVPAIAPSGAGEGATEAATLRAALRSALGAAPAARAA
jgi:DNA repair protein RadA/Sms